jgi:site-specific recombinase XerD
MVDEDAVSEFLQSVDSPNTRRAYETDVRAFLEWTGDSVEVRPVDVGDFIRTLQREGLATSTLRRRLSAVRRFYDWLVDHGHIDRNPARTCRVNLSQTSESETKASGGGKAPASSGDVPNTLSKSEVESLIAATDAAGEAAVRDRGMLLTIVYCALRRAELAAMDVEHVRPLGRYWVIDLPAGDAWSSAYVKVPDAVVGAIDAVQQEYGIESGPLWRSLSNRNRGDRITPDAIYKVVRRTADRAGLEGVDVETLRHTGLRLAVEAGATLQQVQMHARLQTASSADRYADADGRSGRLYDSAVDFVDLDV